MSRGKLFAIGNLWLCVIGYKTSFRFPCTSADSLYELHKQTIYRQYSIDFLMSAQMFSSTFLYIFTIKNHKSRCYSYCNCSWFMMSDYKCNVLFQLPACATMLICLQVPKKSIIVSKRWDFSVWPYCFNFFSFISWSSLLSTNTVGHSIVFMGSVYWNQTE